MPATSTATHKGVTITFTEADHKYETPDFDDFVSSSGIIHQFFPEFDSEAISERIAAKRGKTPLQLRNEWKANADAACDYGTRCHEVAEYIFTDRLSELHTPRNPKEQNTFAVAWNAVQMLKEQYQSIGCELIVFSERLRVCGTLDLLMYDPATNTVLILDWKTNREIKQSAFKGEKGFAPIQHLENCNYHHYSLQLSIYEFLMRHEGYYPPDTKYRRALIHLTETEPIWYELPCRQFEVSQMLLYHKTSHWELEKGLPF